MALPGIAWCTYIVPIKVTRKDVIIPAHECGKVAQWMQTRNDGSKVYRCNQHKGK